MPPRKQEIDWQYIFDRMHPEPNSGCWLWAGELNNAGYGRIVRGNNHCGLRVRSLAHRVTYQMARGDIPEGFDLDHKCRVRCCCNPDHLEPVTRSENNLRGDLSKRRGVKLRKSSERWAIGLMNANDRKRARKSQKENANGFS